MSAPSLADRLAALDAAVAEASARRQAAWRCRQNEFEVSVEATADLTAYRDDVGYRRRDPDPDEQRRLTRELAERIERDGLVLEAAGGGNGLLIVRDPAVMRELEAAMEALDEAKRARRAFVDEHGEEIEAEQKAAAAERVREALDSDDPDRMREALGIEGPPKNILRSAAA